MHRDDVRVAVSAADAGAGGVRAAGDVVDAFLVAYDFLAAGLAFVWWMGGAPGNLVRRD